MSNPPNDEAQNSLLALDPNSPDALEDVMEYLASEGLPSSPEIARDVLEQLKRLQKRLALKP